MTDGSTDASPALYDVDPEALAALVLSCPAVAALSGGAVGGAATYLPGRAVPGIRIQPGAVEVHVVVRYGPTVSELARQIRHSLTGRVQDRTIDIVVEDVADPTSAEQRSRTSTGEARVGR